MASSGIRYLQTFQVTDFYTVSEHLARKHTITEIFNALNEAYIVLHDSNTPPAAIISDAK